MRIATTITTVGLLAASAILTAGCSAPTVSEAELMAMETAAKDAKAQFIAEDPGMETWFADSYGYAIFPTIGKGGVGLGGAYGEGLVYERGTAIGTVSMEQVTIGFQLGGQSYQQVVFFEAREHLEEFTSGNFEFGAQASAVAATAGASADADFDSGMAVFTVQNGGLMYEASIGGQKFNYRPLKADDAG